MSLPLEGAAAEEDVKRHWRALAAATIAFGFGFGVNTGSLPSFAAGVLELSRTQLGWLEALREVPGLLTAVIISLAAGIAEPRLALLAMLFIGAGIAATGQAGHFGPLVACNVFWSIGLHVWLTVQPSLTLTLSRAGHYGHGLGLMNRYMALAVMGGLLFVRLLGQPLGFGWTFGLGGAAIMLGSLFLARLPRTLGGGLRQRLVFRPAYWRYYLLMLLDGGRRQVVMTFAVLILVKQFRVGLGAVALLLLLNNGLTMLAAPVVGRWTDRHGERRVLTWYYALVAVVFFGYTRVQPLAAQWGVPPVLVFGALFAIDNLLFTASVGIQTYIRHSAPRADLSPSLAMGLTWNHVAAVTVPLAAGWIWEHQGFERIFLYGIGMVLASWGMCLTLPGAAPHAATASAPAGAKGPG